jgi:hypothetical protein
MLWIMIRRQPRNKNKNVMFRGSVADPDPYVLGPTGSGSGSISTRYDSGFGSGFFYHKKIARKTLIATVL